MLERRTKSQPMAGFARRPNARRTNSKSQSHAKRGGGIGGRQERELYRGQIKQIESLAMAGDAACEMDGGASEMASPLGL